MPEGLEMVQMGRSKADRNALNEGNATQVSACQSQACSISKHMI